MIGDEYFRVRADVGAALFSLQTLAHELHVTREAAAGLHEMAASLREPFLFVVAGESGAGKSSLINAIFGRELCAVEPTDGPGDFHLLKYGPREKDVRVTERLVDCYRPVFLLRDFNVLDTPGTESLSSGDDFPTGKFLPAADLILLVFSATNPWKSATWPFLDLVPRDRLGHVVLVIQQADLRKPLEIEAMVNHLKQVGVKKYQTAFPVYVVSAQKSYLAKTNGVDKERLLAEGGVAALETYIDETIALGEERWGRLRAACGSCQETLRDFAENARTAVHLIGQRAQKLADLVLELEDRSQQSLRQVNGALWTMSQSYERAERIGESLLDRKLSPLGLIRSILQTEDWRDDFQEQIDGELIQTVKRHLGSSLATFGNDLESLWIRLHELLRGIFPAREVPSEDAPAFIHDRPGLLSSVGEAMQQQAAATRLEGSFAALVRTAKRAVRFSALTMALCVIAAVVALMLGYGSAAATLAAVALIAGGSGVAVAMLKRSEARTIFRTALLRRREELIAQIEDYLRAAIESYYGQLQVSLEPARAAVEEEREIYEPIIVRVHQLEASFAKCAADLGLVRAG